jgi:hypothetical protein
VGWNRHSRKPLLAPSLDLKEPSCGSAQLGWKTKMSKDDERYRVEVKHHIPNSERYTWEIHRSDMVLPVKQSETGFDTWEAASQAGKLALKEFLVTSDNQSKD